MRFTLDVATKMKCKAAT